MRLDSTQLITQCIHLGTPYMHPVTHCVCLDSICIHPAYFGNVAHIPLTFPYTNITSVLTFFTWCCTCPHKHSLLRWPAKTLSLTKYLAHLRHFGLFHIFSLFVKPLTSFAYSIIVFSLSELFLPSLLLSLASCLES